LAARRAESSVEASSTIMISAGESSARTDRIAPGRNAAALWKGMTTETSGEGVMGSKSDRNLHSQSHWRRIWSVGGIGRAYVSQLAHNSIAAEHII
jgi:hypothetical protein